jgi:hypothetical protein
MSANVGSVKDKLRRSAAYLQGGNTNYLSRFSVVEAIRLIYRIADTCESRSMTEAQEQALASPTQSAAAQKEDKQ